MKNIHRFYESLKENEGFLHHVCYGIDSENRALVTSLQTHLVQNDIVTAKIFSHEDPLTEVSLIAAYSILLKDGVMDENTNIIEH